MIKLKSTDSYRVKKRSAVDRTAAEWNYVAHATRRRRRILLWQDSFLNAAGEFYYNVFFHKKNVMNFMQKKS